MKIKLLLLSLFAAGSLIARADEPKYIFYFIGDGMGMGPAVAAEMYNRQVLQSPMPITMYRFPVVSQALTYSASSPVTDSAAAGTALSAGHKTKNGMLGMDADTLSVTSMAKVLQADGYGIGVVTSVAPDDATPGAFYAHVPNRSMYYQIGVQAAESGYQFLAGAGLRGVTDKDGNSTDLLKVMERNDVKIVRGAAALDSVSAEKIFLLNNPGTEAGNIGYTIDSIPGVLTLPVITQACLDHLRKVSPDRFFMMVEGGNIDHALHGNDGGAAIKEVLNFNQALDIAYNFYKRHPDETLIVVTADHDTGGMTIGNPFLGYNARLQYIDSQKVSKERFSEFCKSILRSRRTFTWDDMREYLTENFGFWNAVPLTDAQTQSLRDKFDATFELRNSADQKTLYANFNSFAVAVYKVFNDAAGIGFVATSHTGNPVPVMAVGVDAHRFSHLNNNIDIPGTILSIAGKSLPQ